MANLHIHMNRITTNKQLNILNIVTLYCNIIILLDRCISDKHPVLMTTSAAVVWSKVLPVNYGIASSRQQKDFKDKDIMLTGDCDGAVVFSRGIPQLLHLTVTTMSEGAIVVALDPPQGLKTVKHRCNSCKEYHQIFCNVQSLQSTTLEMWRKYCICSWQNRFSLNKGQFQRRMRS